MISTFPTVSLSFVISVFPRFAVRELAVAICIVEMGSKSVNGLPASFGALSLSRPEDWGKV